MQVSQLCVILDTTINFCRILSHDDQRTTKQLFLFIVSKNRKTETLRVVCTIIRRTSFFIRPCRLRKENQVTAHCSSCFFLNICVASNDYGLSAFDSKGFVDSAYIAQKRHPLLELTQNQLFILLYRKQVPRKFTYTFRSEKAFFIERTRFDDGKSRIIYYRYIPIIFSFCFSRTRVNYKM